MIRALHYLAGGLLILALSYQIQFFYNISAGIMFGFCLGSWIQYRYETVARDEEIKELSYLIHKYLKSKTYDPNIPDGESCREK